MRIKSPRSRRWRFRPSMDTQAVLRVSSGTAILISTVDGNTTGRKEMLCGQTGVSRMAGTLGCTIEPPAATYWGKSGGEGRWRGEEQEHSHPDVVRTEYAVEPVGVATITPSPCTAVIRCSLQKT